MRRRAAKVILCVTLMMISLSVTACDYHDAYKNAKEETEKEMEREEAEEKTERHSFFYKLFTQKQADYVDDEAAGTVAEEADISVGAADAAGGETDDPVGETDDSAEEAYTDAGETGVPVGETYTVVRKSGVPAEEIYIDSWKTDDPAEAVMPAEDSAAVEEAVGETLEVYLNSVPGVRKMIERMIANELQDGMSVTTEVKGNSFICKVTFDDISMFTDDIDAEFEALAHIFRQAAARMDEMIGQDGAVTIVIRCLDYDGRLLAERKFKAK